VAPSTGRNEKGFVKSAGQRFPVEKRGEVTASVSVGSQNKVRSEKGEV
jgi:hypothetical protein